MVQGQPIALLKHSHCYEIDVMVIMEIEYLGEGILINSVVKASFIALQSELERIYGMEKNGKSEDDGNLCEH